MREITQNDIRFILPFKGFIFGDKIKIKGKYNRYITLAHGMGKNTEYYDLKSQGFGQDFWYMGYWYYKKNFGMKGHNGIDYRTPVNCKVFSQTDGIVIKTHDINDDYGKYIIIRTPEFMIDGVRCRYETIYAHLNKVDVKLNDTVKQGDYIALSGNTGKWTTGPHIHNASRLYWYENGAWKYDKNNGYSGYVDIEHLIKYKYIYPTNR